MFLLVSSLGVVPNSSIDESQTVSLNPPYNNSKVFTYSKLRTDLMMNQAVLDGIDLKITSSYRTEQMQAELRGSNCPNGDVSNLPRDSCFPATNKPGESMHERGIALDFSCGKVGSYAFKNTNCFSWLKNNAIKYGYINLEIEPWHWSVNGL